jgi:iron complex transport system substrate-binding protein
LLVLLLGLLASGCGAEEPSASGLSSCPKYATGFGLEYLADGCRVVTDGEARQLLLVPRGHKVPEAYRHLPVVHTPVRRVVVASTTTAALLRPLEELESIIAVTTDREHWYIPEVRIGLEEGRIRLVGNDMGPLDYEAVLELNPDLVFIYTGSPEDLQKLKKLEELKIPVAVDNSHRENHPLGRVEWVKFLAAFYGKEDRAEQYFQRVVENTEAVTRAVAGATSRPRVLWGLIYQGEVYVPAGDSYVAKMIGMAGGDYLFKDLGGTGSATVSLEEFYRRGLEAEVFISSTLPNYGTTSIAKLVEQEKRLADLPVIRAGRVWCFQPWYYQSIDKADEMFADLAAIFHPDLFREVELKHHMKLPATDR